MNTCTNMDQFPSSSLHTYSSMPHNMILSHKYGRCSRVLPHLHESMCGARVQSCMATRTININTCTNMDHFPSRHSSEMLWVHASVILTPVCTPRAIMMLPPCYHVTFALHSYRQLTSDPHTAALTAHGIHHFPLWYCCIRTRPCPSSLAPSLAASACSCEHR